MATSAEHLHLVILPLPAYGHIIPALVLANKLLHRGYQVTFICHEYKLKQVLSQAKARGCHQSISFRTLKRNSPGGEGAEEESSPAERDPAGALEWLLTRSRDDAAEVREIMSSLFGGAAPPSCLITDYLQSEWSQDIADELKIPRVVLFPQSALALTVVFHLKRLVEQGRYPIGTSDLIYIPGLEGSSAYWPLLPEDISTGMQMAGAMSDFYRNNCLRVHDAAGVLCNTFGELEPDACKAIEDNTELNPRKVPFLAVGPLLPDSYLDHGGLAGSPEEEVESSCILWLDRQPEASVVYVSFGSLAKLRQEQVEELAEGLEASGERFLWVLAGERESMLPDGFKERVKERSLILGSWAPQLAILSHSSVAGFLSHCGWNSTMESICQGKPMITLPLFAEQGGNAKMIVQGLGVGVCIAKGGGGAIQRGIVQAVVKGFIHEGETLKVKADVLRQAAHSTKGAEVSNFLNKVLLKKWKF